MKEREQNEAGQAAARPVKQDANEDKRPFRDAALPAEENPGEEADAEQQRKEALTERD